LFTARALLPRASAVRVGFLDVADGADGAYIFSQRFERLSQLGLRLVGNSRTDYGFSQLMKQVDYYISIRFPRTVNKSSTVSPR